MNIRNNYQLSIANYQLMKPSGVDWLGDIPAHWEPLKITNATTVKSEKNHPDEKLLSVYRDYGVIIKNSRDDNYNRAGEDLRNYKLVKPGYLVLNKMKTWQGSLGVSEYQGIVSPAYITCEVDSSKVFPKYLHYLLRCRRYVFEYDRLSYGVRVDQWDMRYQDFKNIPIFLPPLAEQTAIANFLDRKTAQIDDYVTLKKKTMALLQEQKSAIINAAVTGKLIIDNGQLIMDNSQLKRDSGIEWLGRIPAHWEVKKLKYVGIVNTGMAKNSFKVTNLQSLVPYLRVANVQDGYLDLTDVATIAASSTDIEKYKLRKGDLLMNEGGDFDKLGRGCVWNGEIPICLHQNHVFAVRINKGISPYWVNFLTLTHYGKCYFISKSKQTTNLASISSRNLAEFPVLLPPAAEANEIMELINSTTAKIDQAIAQAQRQIDLIKEYRETLISRAVTGKIKIIDN